MEAKLWRNRFLSQIKALKKHQSPTLPGKALTQAGDQPHVLPAAAALYCAHFIIPDSRFCLFYGPVQRQACHFLTIQRLIKRPVNLLQKLQISQMLLLLIPIIFLPKRPLNAPTKAGSEWVYKDNPPPPPDALHNTPHIQSRHDNNRNV
ncbi:MAG: hypothetical protein R3E31_07515 [Chloroflexota bacterium]